MAADDFGEYEIIRRIVGADSSTASTGSNFTDHNISTYRWVHLTDWTSPHVEANATISATKKGGIHPRLCFTFLKTKMSAMQGVLFKRRLAQLEKMSEEYFSIGQEALGEECVKQFLIISRESAAWACGYKKYVTPELLERFRGLSRIRISVTELENFARPLPKDVTKKLKQCQDKKLFDGYEIVHADQEAVKETEKERIERERDPILFGRIEFSPRYYFIADWEDEFCHLRLNDIVKKLSLKSAPSLKAAITKRDIHSRDVDAKKKDPV